MIRHEMLSVQLAERLGVPGQDAERDLILHLIAAHHGYARPFAPVVLDKEPPDVEYAGVALSSAERGERPLHRLDSGIADRFWSLTRRFGWWGLVGLKYSTVMLVVMICESVGRTRPRLGRALATAAVAISALPVGLGLLQVAAWTHLG